MIGQTISHYKIIEKLGEGGMGVVYKAEDLKLGRAVALKFLPSHLIESEEYKARFLNEARAAALLDHPNICTVYEIDEAGGQAFLAMAYLEGQTLKQKIAARPLPLNEALDIAIQIGQGLQAAHAKGIVHRDIKPANIMIAPQGQVKIMDFGLAQLSNRTELTATGMKLGTPAYMSPEQTEGKPADRRSDIWALGVALYEMICGRVPFAGETEAAVAYGIVHTEPEAPTALRSGLPISLDRVVTKALAKDAAERYQHVEDMLVDLRALRSPRGIVEAAPPPSKLARRAALGAVAGGVVALGAMGVYMSTRRDPIDSLAVLPFVNAGGDPDTEYLSEGISESLITGLSRLPGLKVKSRDTVFRYQGQDKDLQQVGRELGVRAVVKGRLVQRGDDLSISAELVDTSDGNLLWREQYSRKAVDILAIEREISTEISEQLRLRLTGEEQRRLLTEATRNPEAYRLYLQGRYWWNRRTEESLKKSTEYFQQAIEQDPNYAEAWTGLADSFLNLGSSGATPPAEAFHRAQSAASRAIEIQPSLAEPHASLGHLKVLYEWDWPGAGKEFRRAIELNPESPTVRHWYAFYLLSVGQPEDALDEIRRARELDPLSPIMNVAVARFEYSARRYSKAVEEARKAMEMDPQFSRPHLALGYAYALQRHPKEAKAEFEQALQLSNRSPLTLSIAGAGLGFLGETDEARKLLQELSEISRKRYVAPWMPGLIYAGMGEEDSAVEYFESALQERALPPWYLRDPLLDSIRSNPRFQSILQRMGLQP